MAQDRVVSAGDPEMQHDHKSKNRRSGRYKSHLSFSAESEFVTARTVTPGNARYVEAAPALLDHQQEVGLRTPATVGNKAFSPMALREKAQERGTKICARVPPASAHGNRFSKEEFELNLEAGTATCPAGQGTDRWQGRKGEGGGYFLFDGAGCAACELGERCTVKDAARIQRLDGDGP